MSLTEFCFGTFAAECFNNDFRFKFGGESFAFSFGCHSDAPFYEIGIVAQSWFGVWSKFSMAVQGAGTLNPAETLSRARCPGRCMQADSAQKPCPASKARQQAIQPT